MCNETHNFHVCKNMLKMVFFFAATTVLQNVKLVSVKIFVLGTRFWMPDQTVRPRDSETGKGYDFQLVASRSKARQHLKRPHVPFMSAG